MAARNVAPPLRFSQLAQAADHATSGEFPQAIEALRRAWAAGPHAALAAPAADLLEKLAFEPFATGVVAEQQAWLRAAARADPAQLPQLVKAQWPRSVGAARERMQALARFKADLLLSVAVRKLVRSDPFGSRAGDVLLRLGMTTLFKLKDPLAPVLVHELLADAGREADRHEGYEALSRRVAPRSIALTADEEAALSRLGSVLRGSGAGHDLAALEAAIYASPGDDGLRALYADALGEAGDPRGEFIALQLARRAGRGDKHALAREKALLREHGRAWLGALAPFIEIEPEWFHQVFSRGFVAFVRLAEDYPDQPFAGTVQWATVETIDRWGFDGRHSGYRGEAQPFEFHPHLRGLRELAGVSALGPTPVGPLARLEFAGPLDELAEAPLSSVECLQVGKLKREGLLRLLETRPWGRAVRELDVPDPAPTLVAARSWLAALPALSRMTLRSEGWAFTLGRDDEGQLVPLRGTDSAWNEARAVCRSANELRRLRFTDAAQQLDGSGRKRMRGTVESLVREYRLTTPITAFED